MCGIAGYVAIDKAVEGCGDIIRMVRTMSVRGPDDEGVAIFDGRGLALALTTAQTDPGYPREPGAMTAERCALAHTVALGQRRFSIVDLSPNGHQPFWSSDGAVAVVFNGEIYNYVELRAELEKLGHTFRTSSDTEVLVAGYRQWGERCFERFAGFWAVALFDRAKGAVLLSRDRIGKAPLYVARAGGRFVFGSEIKTVLAGAGGAGFRVRPQAVSDFVTFAQRDVGNSTFYDGIESFPAASYAWVRADGTYSPVRYWDFPRGRDPERARKPAEAAAELRSLLVEALRVRFRADVPVGVELSGGLDSSALVCLAASSGQRLRAFTVSFPGTPWDEEPFARKVYERHREMVEYHVIRPQLADFFDVADGFVAHMDEPFHSPNMETSQRLWKQMAGEGIRVSINGAAADECFGGYPGMYHVPQLSRMLERGRLASLHREAMLLSEAPAAPLSPLYLSRLRKAVVHSVRVRFPGMDRRSPTVMSTYARAGRVLGDGPAATLRPTENLDDLLLGNMTDWMMNYWLRSGHQNFMGVPVEVRAPFLDHRVVEFAFRLPTSFLMRDGWLKWIIREAVRDIMPDEVTWRRNKMGFPFPFETWLPANKARFFAMVQGDECPHIDMQGLRAGYDELAATDPSLLWRAMSVCLWWKRCVLGRPLESAPAGSARA